MATAEASLGTDRVLKLVNYLFAMIVAFIYLSPLGNFKLGLLESDIDLATFANGSDGSSQSASSLPYKNMSNSCVALWLQEYTVPLDHLCLEPAVGADIVKESNGWLDRMGSGLGFPLTERQDVLASFCPGEDIFALSDDVKDDKYPMLNRQRCLAHWFNDRILPEPIYS